MPVCLLVKHSLPTVDSSIPANEWLLSDEGRSRAQELAEKLFHHDIGRVFSSVEAKASETAVIVAESLKRPIEVVAGLHEHERTTVGFLEKEQFEGSVDRFFARPAELNLGEETADTAYARFSYAVRGISGRFPRDNLAIVTHGTVMSLFASRISGCEPFNLWKQLDLPSWIVFSHPDFVLEEVFSCVGEGSADNSRRSTP